MKYYSDINGYELYKLLTKRFSREHAERVVDMATELGVYKGHKIKIVARRLNDMTYVFDVDIG